MPTHAEYVEMPRGPLNGDRALGPDWMFTLAIVLLILLGSLIGRKLGAVMIGIWKGLAYVTARALKLIIEELLDWAILLGLLMFGAVTWLAAFLEMASALFR
jgi:multisubunit Na+/H+ antiporter MnhF subunit